MAQVDSTAAPLVSIIIPHFNRVGLLSETLSSIKQQYYANWEVIIVDDGSDDTQWVALTELASNQIRILRRTDGIKGPSRCRNLGVKAANADYLVFVDSDDVLAPWCLSQRMAKAIAEPELGLWIFQVMLFQQQPGDDLTCWNRLEGHDDLDRFLRSNPPWHTTSPLWRREVFEAVDGFNEQIFYGDDSDLHTRVLLKSISYKKYPESLPDAFIRRGADERITNAQWRKLEESRMVRLFEGTNLLAQPAARQHSKSLWEGQYFVEAEELLFNVENPNQNIKRIIDEWASRYQPPSYRKLLVRIYFAIGIYFRDRFYLLTRINRRVAKVLLPSTFFPKDIGFHQWQLSATQIELLNEKLEIPVPTTQHHSDRTTQPTNLKGHVRKLLIELSKLPQWTRNTILYLENRRRLGRQFRDILKNNSTPIFFIFTPEIVHFAPYCIPDDAAGFEPVLILNSVSAEDESWLKSLYPQHSVISLKASLKGNPLSLLAHGVVLDALFETVRKPFCIQDPDCFVTHPSFWDQVKLDTDADLAAGPFVKRLTDRQHVLPNTYFLMFNPFIFRTISRRYGISADSGFDLKSRAESKVQELGYQKGQYPEQSKGYFDTLQAYWLLALAEGYRFKAIPGDGKTVFHIGGTSYLHSSDVDLFHWDYWPLSVIYFNLKLLERPEGERFRQRFSKIINKFGSSENLLAKFPEFVKTWRYDEMQSILQHIAR